MTLATSIQSVNDDAARIRKYTSDATGYFDENGVLVESLAHFVIRKDAEINLSAAGTLAGAVAARNAADADVALTNANVILTATNVASAQAARDAALLARGIFASTADGLSKGVASLTSIVAGTGGADGTFDLAFSGGAGSGAAGRFTVAGGAVVSTSIFISYPGRGYTSAPTVSFAASAGLTGASATAVIANNSDSGEYFGVVGGPGNTSLIDFYANTAGSAAFQGTIYSKTYFDTIFSTQPIDPLNRFVFTDAANNIVLQFDENTISHPQIVAIAAAAATNAVAGSTISDGLGLPSLPIVDAANNLLMLITPDEIKHPMVQANTAIAANGQKSARLSRRLNGLTLSTAHLIRSVISHWIWYGQSVSAGSNSNGHLSLVAPGAYGLMFNGGVFSREGYTSTDTEATTGVARGSLVPVVETVREIGAVSALKMFAQALLDEDGIDIGLSGQQILVSSAGVGGVNIAALASTYFFRVSEDFRSGTARAAALSKSYGVGALMYFGNESDQSTATIASFRTALRSMRAQVEAAATTETGIAQSVPMLIYQTSTHFSTASANYTNATAQVAQAQLAASLNADAVDDNIAMATPTYFLRYPDGVHPDGVGYAWMCAYFGLAAKRWFVDGIKPRPLSPTAAVRYGSYVRVKFPVQPGYQLTVDNAGVPAQPNFGLEMTTSAGAAKTITSARLCGPDTVELLVSGGSVAGDIVKYAFSTNVAGGTLGLGNLRDNQGDFIIADPAGINKPLHSWVPISTVTVS